MNTNNSFVSRVIGEAKALTKDDHISRRLVLSIGRDKVRTYVSQKLKDKTLYREDNIFVPIECFELEKVNSVNCDIVQFRRCDILMKSKVRVPEPIFSSYGPAILRVSSLDGLIDFEKSTITSYSNNKNRKYSKLVPKYYLHDGYIFIPDFEVEVINLDVLTLLRKEAIEASTCQKCDVCKSVWDYEFVCPDKLYEPIVKETILEVVQIMKQIVIDEKPDLNNNQK